MRLWGWGIQLVILFSMLNISRLKTDNNVMKNYILHVNFTILTILVILSTSCEKKINGVVHNDKGVPLEGVLVTIEKSGFSSTTDNLGRYSIDYSPGHINILFSKGGHIDNNLSLDIQKKTSFPAQAIILDRFYVNHTSPEKLSKSIVQTLISNDENTFISFACPTEKTLLNSLKSGSPEDQEKEIKEIKMFYKEQINKIFNSWTKIKNENINWSSAKFEGVEYETRLRKSNITTADIYITVSSNGVEYKLKLDDANLIGDSWYLFDEIVWEGPIKMQKKAH